MNTVYFHSAGVDLYSLLNTEYTGHVFVFHNRHIFLKSMSQNSHLELETIKSVSLMQYRFFHCGCHNGFDPSPSPCIHFWLNPLPCLCGRHNWSLIAKTHCALAVLCTLSASKNSSHASVMLRSEQLTITAEMPSYCDSSRGGSSNLRKGGATFSSPPLLFPSPPLLLPPLPLEVGPLNPARRPGLGERCKLPQQGPPKAILGAQERHLVARI